MPEPLEPVLLEVRTRLLDLASLSRAVLSGHARNAAPPCRRVDLRPVMIRGSRHLQVVRMDERTATTSNVSGAEAEAEIDHLLEAGWGNLLVESVDGRLEVRVTKRGLAQVHRSDAGREQDLAHDRQKERLLDPADPLFVALGISDADGRLKPSRRDKHRQVEEFLRLLVPTVRDAIAAGHLRTPTQDAPLRMVDLGCGHAYLTFAAHAWLSQEGIPVITRGVDVREDSRRRNEQIAASLGLSASIAFSAEAIADARPFDDDAAADLVIALHACDTATDDALAWAVHHGAAVILAAPCCHHDLQVQMAKADPPAEYVPVMRHGLLRERFGDLLTDGLRAHLLRLVGHRVDVVEFVAGEHTPRNLMIRAVRTGASPEDADVRRYLDLTREWHVTPALQERLARDVGPLLSAQ